MNSRRTLLLLILWLVVAPTLSAQDDELSYGLLSETGAGDAQQRVDADLSFVFGGGGAGPSLPEEPITRTWRGQVLIRAATTYTFHVYVHGSVEILIDGESVLSGTADQPRWVSGAPVDLGFGFQTIAVDYSHTKRTGRLHVYWSSERFPLEPLPAHLLFRVEDDVDEATGARLADLARGRPLYDAYRCNRCHRAEGELLSPPGPDLTHLSAGLSTEWLRAKLLHSHAEAEHSRMPAFGFSDADADALTAFLLDASQPADLLDVPKLDLDPKQPPPEGDFLLNSLGCLACHRVGELGEAGPYGGGDLSQIGSRRSREWIFTQLTEPARVNRHSRMPVFDLTDVERVQLTEALTKLTGDGRASFTESPSADADEALIERGRSLFAAARCAACHELPGQTADLSGVPSLQSFVAEGQDWSGSCLAREPDRNRLRPAYPHVDHDALKAVVTAQTGSAPSSATDFDFGRLLLERKNCLACHERDRRTGIVATAGRVTASDSRLAGQSQALIPPNLTAVGDKLLDDALALAVSGKQKSRRMPWLQVRMPRFTHTDEESDALLAYLVGHDRIPDAAPATRNGVLEGETDAQTLLTGRTLVGAGGFSCIACHDFGDYAPPNVAIASHGSDLLGLKSRMRPEFFLRWTRSPLRIVPGMEMPSYERPVPGVLHGNADEQIAALWHALNDPDFTAPTNPTAVEQFLVVSAGAPPRVVRDVFTVSEKNGGGYVPRALAVGFDNGHSVLFDLDHACVRDWTLGDFARQRTQGKSWFWDLAGVPLTGGFDGSPGFVLGRDSGGEWLPLGRFEDGRMVRLKSYGTVPRSERGMLRIEYEIAAEAGGEPSAIRISDEFSAIPAQSQGASGWSRRITAEGVPDGYTLAVIRPDVEPGEFGVFSAAALEEPKQPGWQPIGEGREAGLFVPTVGGVQERLLHYDCRVDQPAREAPPIPEVPASAAPVTTAAGFDGVRLRLPASIMPTSIAWTGDGTLVFTSLKGHVYMARDTDGDGIEDALSVVEDGLAAPFGLLPDGDDLLVMHKAELLRLRDTDGDGRADQRIVLADGWGYTHDYHDWSSGPVRDETGNLFIATSSDYSHKDRDPSAMRWRGKILRISTDGRVEPIAHELRYPIGIAIDPAGRLFVSDQQGVANTFNEINHIQPGGRYGVKSLADPADLEEEPRAAVQLPHPWTRSVNGIFFIPPLEETHPLSVFSGHGLGCEYNGRFLMRFTLDEVDGLLQGAAYEFTDTTWETDDESFLGPICGAVSPDGDLYVGSIFDSGWLGGRNTGEIVRLRPSGKPLPNGIREVRAVPEGFRIEFLRPVDPAAASRPGNYTLSGYTRVWQGAYATPDSGRYTPEITRAELSSDAKTVTLHVDDLRETFVYDIACEEIDAAGEVLHPATAYYTMNRVPKVE